MATDISFLNPWDKITRRPRCPECSSHEAETVKVMWLSVDWRCNACGERWTDDQRKDSKNG